MSSARRAPRWTAVAAAAIAIPAAPAPADRVQLRSGEILAGTIETADRGGLSLRRPVDPTAPAGGATAIDRIGWDRIASVHGDAGTDRWPELPSLLADGERLWRARIRLERGDAALATLSAAPWAPSAVDGPTPQVAALIELQLALRAGDPARAAPAWLESLRLRRRGFDAGALAVWLEPAAGGAMVRRPVVDAAMPLCPLLAPVAANDPQRDAMRAAIEAFDPRGDRELDDLRRAFASALDPARPFPTLESVGASGRGVARAADKSGEEGEAAEWRRTIEFLRALRDAQSGVPAERERGREALAQQRRRLPEWAEAWARVAAGKGLLLDGTPAARRAAQLELLHLPARFAEAQPFLAPLAVELAASASRDDGRTEEAERIAPGGAAAPAAP